MSNDMSIYDATKAGAMMIGTVGIAAVCYKTCLALGALQESIDELTRMAKNITDEDINDAKAKIRELAPAINADKLNNVFELVAKLKRIIPTTTA